VSYPPVNVSDQADDFHGEIVADPYRALEDITDPATMEWITAQNELTESVLGSVPARMEITRRLARLQAIPAAGVPFERGGRWFQMRDPGAREQGNVLFVMGAPDGEGRVLLDPNELSADATVAVAAVRVAPDGDKVAYARSESGSDWLTWRVRDVASGADEPDVVRWSKDLAAQWRPDGAGFYYVGMPEPEPGGLYTAPSSGYRVMLHRLSAGQADDEPVFVPDEPGQVPAIRMSTDGQFLIISVSAGLGAGQEIRVLELSRPDRGCRVLLPAGDARHTVVATVGGTFYVLTDDDAGRRRIVAVDGARPGREHWREVVPEAADTLLQAHFFGGRLVCHYLRDGCSRLCVLRLDGAKERDLPLPRFCTLSGSPVSHEAIEGTPASDIVHFEIESCTESASLWRHDLASGQTTLVRAAAFSLGPGYVTERVTACSPDGTPVPMFVTRRAGLPRDGSARVLLHGYGGVGACITPRFSATWAAWLERGGMLAVASLRGGGEYGRAWYHGGRLAAKQNVFDDFCACARWLAASGWSRPDRIAINGGSNGGLLVGACLTQHPELFGAAVANVGVFDMLRFHLFTVGRFWTTEYGDPGIAAEFRWLRRYSPLHNVRPGRYPATMLTTGDHDDRVVPGHTLKFGAALQAAQQGPAPILVRVETAAGHSAGKPGSKAVAEAADMLAFLESALSEKPPEIPERILGRSDYTAY
jgi:prolyl oligopeptidase